MKAVYLVRNGSAHQAFEIREATMPEPKENQVRIQVEAFGLNFADVMARKGKYKDCPPLPCVIGYDVVGRIDALGNKVHGLQIGDRVASLIRFGGYAEYVCVDHRGVAKLPDEMPLTFAGAIATQYCTAYYAAYDCVNIFPGDKVLIHAAAGGVGTALVQLCKHKGAIVFGTCSTEEKIKYLKSLGVDHPINYTTSDYNTVIQQILGKDKLNFVFDSLGGKYFKEGVNLLGAGGKIVGYGAATMSETTNKLSFLKVALQFGIYHPGMLIRQSKTIVGVYMLPLADQQPQAIERCLRGVIKLYEEGVLKPAGGMEYPVAQIADAHEALEKRKTIGKVMVKW